MEIFALTLALSPASRRLISALLAFSVHPAIQRLQRASSALPIVQPSTSCMIAVTFSPASTGGGECHSWDLDGLADELESLLAER